MIGQHHCDKTCASSSSAAADIAHTRPPAAASAWAGRRTDAMAAQPSIMNESGSPAHLGAASLFFSAQLKGGGNFLKLNRRIDSVLAV